MQQTPPAIKHCQMAIKRYTEGVSAKRTRTVVHGDAGAVAGYTT